MPSACIFKSLDQYIIGYSQPLSLVLARATSYICIQVVFVLGIYKKTDANLDL